MHALAEFLKYVYFIVIFADQVFPTFGLFVCGPCSPLWLMFVLYVFWGRRSFIDPICCNSCMVLSMFLRLVLANSLFSLRDINLTLGLLPPRRHVVWRDSVGVESSRLRFTSECKDIFRQSFLWLLRHTDEPQKARNSCLWLHPTLF